MTLQELYAAIDGDYESALRVLRVDKLIDKHICRLPGNAIFNDLFESAAQRDAVRVFESSHAIKGVCGNLGLVKLSGLASDITESFRPGNPRTMSDSELDAKVAEVREIFEKSVEGIRRYESEKQ